MFGCLDGDGCIQCFMEQADCVDSYSSNLTKLAKSDKAVTY